MMIVNDNARIVNKLDASLTDDARVVIYYRHIFIVQASGNSTMMVMSLDTELLKAFCSRI
jgi:hypothetical protein